MRDLLQRLWQLDGTVSRRTYILGGVAGFILKYAIDFSIARAFGKSWSLVNYWHAVSPQITPPLFLVLFVVSIPLRRFHPFH